MKQEKEIFLDILNQLNNNGKLLKPRGLKIIEIENFHYDLLPFVRFMNFKSRKLNLNYIKKEFLWYLKGDKYDLSICKYAKLWKEIINKDSSINSNYGQYIFGKENQFDRVIKTLKKDKDSRQAIIIILTKDHLASITADFPCTMSINFRIRNNFLNMTVHMRSMDGIYGMTNDFPSFSFVHEMMLNALREYYPDLKYGIYHHTADSFHVYERHFIMLNQILNNDKFENIKCPKISGYNEVKFIRDEKNLSLKIPNKFKFTEWLIS